MFIYTEDYYKNQKWGALASARIVLPIVVSLVKPKSVIDIGCGVGSWLQACQELGIQNIKGIDGPYVENDQLSIPRDYFSAQDLRQPISHDRRYDLVISLEVAEHLPKNCAQDFVASLVSLGPVVLFSAAIPHQEGVNHINEQWQDWWAKLFAKHDYKAVDAIRPKIWQNTNVEWWYAQNCILYCNSDELNKNTKLRQLSTITNDSQLSLVHPNNYLRHIYNSTASTARSKADTVHKQPWLKYLRLFKKLLKGNK